MEKSLPHQLDAAKKDAEVYLFDLLQRMSKRKAVTFVVEPIKKVVVETKVEEVKQVEETGTVDFEKVTTVKAVEKKVNVQDFFTNLAPEVMNQFQLNLGNMQSDVAKKLDKIFQEVLNPPKQVVQKKSSLDELTLVNDDQLDLRMVSDLISKQLNEKYAISIALLCLRFEKVLGFEIDLMLNPLGPVEICSAFESSLQSLSLSTPLKKQLLVAILKSMAVEYHQLIQNLNNTLIRKGVLPNLTEKDGKARNDKYVQKMKAKKEAEKAGITEGEGSNNGGDKDGKGNGTGSALMNNIVIPQDSQHSFVANINGPMIQQPQLFQKLDTMNEVLVTADADSGYLKPIETESTFSELLTSNTDISSYGLSPAHQKTISIMSMIFETLSSDKNTSGPIKGLLFQLVIPLLKAAMDDEDFFSESDNPAQVLFNTISEAGMSWSEEKDIKNDFLYQKMSSIVQKVTTEYDQDKNVFDEAITDLGSFVETEKQRSTKIEARMVSAESSKARLDAAKEISKTHIEDVFFEEKMPAPLQNFIENRWQSVLFYIYNKYEDVNCAAWHEAIHLEWKIIGILHGDDAVTVDEIMIELTKQLDAIGLSADVYKLELELIRPCLRFNRNNEALSAPTSEGFLSEPTPEMEAEIEKMYASISNNEGESEKKVKSTDAFASNSDAVETVKEVDSIIAVEQFVERALENSKKIVEKPQSNENAEILKNIGIGSWIEDKQLDPLVKIKLAAYIKYTDTYVLVNRKGAKHASLVSADFAQKFKDNVFGLVDSNISFDRTLESIIGKLRTDGETQSA